MYLKSNMKVLYCLMLLILLPGIVKTNESPGCAETVKTESGRICYFPFIYKDKAYSRCVANGKDRPWCGLIPEVNDTFDVTQNKTWDYCVVRTNRSSRCTFPFTYNNETYSECTSVDRNDSWCNTSDTEWGYCEQPCVHITHFCYDEYIPQRRLCPHGYAIRILTTEIGKSQGEPCVVQDNDCRILSDKLQRNTLLDDLKAKCEFKQSCQNFNLGFGDTFKCGSETVVSHYATMTYVCEQASEAFICGGESVCLKGETDSSSLMSLGIESCTPYNMFNKSCGKNDSFISIDDPTCDIENDRSCVPLTESNVRTYVGDVCVGDSGSSTIVLRHCSTDLYQTEVNNSNETQILCGSGTLPDIDHVESQRCCNSSCEVFKTDISDQIIELCNWEPSCNLLTLNDTFSRSLVYNNTCVNQTSSLQTTIYHDCKRAIFKCTGDIFDDILCDPSSYINVTSVLKGVSTYSDGCKPSAHDVLFVVSEEFPQYFEEVINACNGKTSCSNLMAEAGNAYDRTSGMALVTDYVILKYVCEEKETESTSMAEASTASTSSVSVTVDAGKSTGDNGMPKKTIYIIIGVVAGLLLIVLLVLLIVCCRSKSRKSQTIGEESREKNRISNPYTDSETEEIGLGHVNPLMNQESSYLYIKDKDLLRKSALEGAYQEIPADANNQKPSVGDALAYQDIDGNEKNARIPVNDQVNKDKRPSVDYTLSEYQDIASIKKKERESKLLAEKASQKLNTEKALEEENPAEGAGGIYTVKEMEHVPVEYAEVNKSLKSTSSKPEEFPRPESGELMQNPYYEGLGDVHKPKNMQSETSNASVQDGDKAKSTTDNEEVVDKAVPTLTGGMASTKATTDDQQVSDEAAPSPAGDMDLAKSTTDKQQVTDEAVPSPAGDVDLVKATTDNQQLIDKSVPIA